MEWLFIAVLVLGLPIGLMVWLILRAVSARERIEEISRRLASLELELLRLKQHPAEPNADDTSATPVSVPLTSRPASRQSASEGPKREPITATPPIIPSVGPRVSSVSVSAVQPRPVADTALGPKPEPALGKAELWAAPAPNLVAGFNWEQFMGVKLFAWIGGLALFLGVAFFVKYSFDNNLVPPALRVALGFLAGLGLLVGGVVMSRKNYPALSHTLCATGIVILYAVTFACRSVYHFRFFGTVPTFLLMVLITTIAFLLAVRLNALVVAILGMLGGFLTPFLLSTGQDNPFGLFGYITFLDAGLLVIALHRRWFFLAGLAAAGTAIIEVSWAAAFFEAGRYFEGNKILIALGVLLGFNALYVAASGSAGIRKQTNQWFLCSVLGLVAIALAFAAWFLTFPPLAQRPWLMFTFVFLLDLAVTAVVLLEKRVAPAHSFSGVAVFGLLAFWTVRSLRPDLLNSALVFYLVVAVFHSLLPLVIQRWHGTSGPRWTSQMFPPLGLLLVLMPIFRLTELSFAVWPFVLLVDLLAIALAASMASLLPILAVLGLTLCATGALIYKIPLTLTGLPAFLCLLGAFAVFFVTAGLWLARRFNPEAFSGKPNSFSDLSAPANLAVQLPALSAMLPFLLLMMATLQLPLVNPSSVFGLALLLVVLLLAITRFFSQEWLPAVGLACIVALESTWHFNRFEPAYASHALTWYLLFLAVFAAFPFIFFMPFRERTVPWATAAMAGPLQFFLVHRLVVAAYPNHVMGLLPAAFAVPSLLSLAVILRKSPAATPGRLTQLAWFGGTALFFITLIFPIQFEHQWITIGWALEGAALLWLFHRVPHPGLRLTGVGLLLVAFVRLAVNPAVLDYHARSAVPILNWYLYTYAIAITCLFVGAWLLAPPRHQVLGTNLPPLLAAAGTVLAFLLLNIQIADFFSEPGSTLTFQFSGNFARDMTYSIAWASFALGLLVVGIARKRSTPRYSAVGLLSITLLKLFFHDLANLSQLYRIGALVGVAAIAMLASFAYQRFFTATKPL